jgi:hypothetical protein
MHVCGFLSHKITMKFILYVVILRNEMIFNAENTQTPTF